jgi:hypothetical protein
VSKEWHRTNDTAVLTLYSDKPKAATLSDAGAFTAGGEIPTRTLVLDADETTSVKMPVTAVNGQAGVAVSTADVLYAVKLGGNGLDGPPVESQWLALLVGIACGPAAIGLSMRIQNYRDLAGVIQIGE